MGRPRERSFLAGLPQRSITAPVARDGEPPPDAKLLSVMYLLRQALIDRTAAGHDLSLAVQPHSSMSPGSRSGEVLTICRAEAEVARLDLVSGRLTLALAIDDADWIVAMGWGRRCRDGRVHGINAGTVPVTVEAATTPCEVLVMAQLVEAAVRRVR